MQTVESFQSWYRGLPDKKRYLEFISAFLSIPVLVTVVVLNLRSLKAQDREQPQNTPIATQVIIKEVVIPGSPLPAPSVSPQSSNVPTPTPISSPSPSPSISSTPTPVPTPTPDVSPIASP